MYPISLKLEALGLLESMSDYKVAEKLGIPRRTIRNWTKQRFELLAYEGNKKRMKIEPGRRREAFPDPPGLADFINQLRDAERALTMLHLYTWINQREGCSLPGDETKRVKIQHDNTRRDVPPSEDAIVVACMAMVWEMEVVFQPPNSPYFNVLDLGFFRAIQTLQVEKHSSSLEGIVAATDMAWVGVSTTTLIKNFLTLQRCLQEVILETGGNDYKIQHIKKNVLLARGRLPEMDSCVRKEWKVVYLSTRGDAAGPFALGQA
ncbi:hypothetical protein DYB37_012837 [Aphanomyces astaci]|uniref:HTH psq-type domain-containing protein n=1 Tax=Aphanomyces astaci TaxID=112090 RepID=A0A3R6Y4M5_APHAT|nr:hypothetical protein DYB35_012049 [Aphanomyces astaci]RHZ19383.1 hypothetical protein DYB37_012837 [Aphanomyces astaci]